MTKVIESNISLTFPDFLFSQMLAAKHYVIAEERIGSKANAMFSAKTAVFFLNKAGITQLILALKWG